MTTFLIVVIVLLALAVAGLMSAGATLVRERDEWESFARSVQDELMDRAEADA